MKLPIAVEKISCSAGLPVVSDWPALPSAESELPPKSTITSVGLKFAVGTSASGTPSRFVSTGFAVRGSGRATSWLKNCVGEPRSYLTPNSSTSVRLMKMIFAWIETWGVRMSSPRTNCST